MSRETALDRVKRENRDLTAELEGARRVIERQHEERLHLEARCKFLYEKAMEFARETAGERLIERKEAWR